ncbi:MAG: DUF2085 domain-containing protein [Vicinamibacterales bacterium]
MVKLARVLVVLSVLWPLTLGLAVWQRATGARDGWAATVYFAGGLVCHQLPARSFSTAGVTWPVCGRCSGLYLAAPLGALAALVWRRRRTDRDVAWLALAAVPTAATLGLEWGGLVAVSNVMRLAAALPLGAALAWVIVRVAAGPSRPIGYTAGS